MNVSRSALPMTPVLPAKTQPHPFQPLPASPRERTVLEPYLLVPLHLKMSGRYRSKCSYYVPTVGEAVLTRSYAGVDGSSTSIEGA